MADWIHLLFQIASLVPLLVIRLRRAQREALRDLAVFAFNPDASGHGLAGSSLSRNRETGHV